MKKDIIMVITTKLYKRRRRMDRGCGEEKGAGEALDYHSIF